MIDALLRKWLQRLPHPFTQEDRAKGFRYDVSILQAEFSTTHLLASPVHGRLFLEEVVREHIGLGRPDQVSLIFERRITKRTPWRFRSRVITEGVTPSLHLEYKHSRIKLEQTSRGSLLSKDAFAEMNAPVEVDCARSWRDCSGESPDDQCQPDDL